MEVQSWENLCAQAEARKVEQEMQEHADKFRREKKYAQSVEILNGIFKSYGTWLKERPSRKSDELDLDEEDNEGLMDLIALAESDWDGMAKCSLCGREEILEQLEFAGMCYVCIHQIEKVEDGKFIFRTQNKIAA